MGIVGRGTLGLVVGGARPRLGKSTAGDDRYPRLRGLE